MTSGRFARPALKTCTLLVLALALGMGSRALAQDATPAASPSASPTAAACDTEAAIASAAASYAIVSEDSTARYISEEQVSGIGAQTAIGETQAIIGTILFDDANVPLACSRFDVDLRTLESDSSRRDNYLYGNTLQTEQFPLATFVLTAVEGMDGPLVEGEETTVTLIGDLSLHGVTNLVAWEAVVTLDGDTITGAANTEFQMPEFEITPPKAGPVISLEELVKLEFDLTLTRV